MNFVRLQFLIQTINYHRKFKNSKHTHKNRKINFKIITT